MLPLIGFGWLLFRVHSMEQVGQFFRFFSASGTRQIAISIEANWRLIVAALLLLAATALIQIGQERYQAVAFRLTTRSDVIAGVVTGALIFISIFLRGNASPFIYFQFLAHVASHNPIIKARK